jgi:glycosyltransferase involved in cell wall biosynthesis
LKPILEDLPDNVNIYTSKLARTKLHVLMARSHCLVFASKGEGFGIPPREAMSTGLPVILAGFAGLESIAKEEIAFPLNWTFESAYGEIESIQSNSF